jgi:hypothetical protein
VNLFGQIVYQKKTDNPSIYQINTSELLKDSIYFVTIEEGNSKITKELLVSRVFR